MNIENYAAIPTAYLLRNSTSDTGTFGQFRIGDYQCHCGELPWRDNSRNVSCIPAGIYRVTKKSNMKWEFDGTGASTPVILKLNVS